MLRRNRREPLYREIWFGWEEIPWASKVMRTSIVARGCSLLLCAWSDCGAEDWVFERDLGVAVDRVFLEDLRRWAEGRDDSFSADVVVLLLLPLVLLVTEVRDLVCEDSGDGVLEFDTICGANA